MRKVVGERSFGNIDRQLTFDDWTWESLEEARYGEASYCETLTPAEAVAFFEEHFSGDPPIELAYQTAHPKPVTAFLGNKVVQFDPKGWSLYGLASEYDDPMGETGYAYETWLFGAKDKFLTIAFGYHVGADVALDTQVELLTKDGAADFLKLNGYSLPEELRGFGKVATLNPGTIEHLPLSVAGALDKFSPQTANHNAAGSGSASAMAPDERDETDNEGWEIEERSHHRHFDSYWPDLDPKPGDLVELKNRFLSLAHEIETYETYVVGHPMSLLADANDSRRIAFSRVLWCVDHLGDWRHNGKAFRDFDIDGDFEWEGWDELTDDYCDWEPALQTARRVVVSALNNAGVPFDELSTSIRLGFQGESEKRFDQPSANLLTSLFEDRGEKPEVIATVLENAIFRSLGVTSEVSFGEGPVPVATALQACAEWIRDTIDGATSRHLKDGRTWTVDLTRSERHRGGIIGPMWEPFFPDDLYDFDPFDAALELEGLTGVRLRSDGDPVWLLMQHRSFRKAAETFGEKSTFAEYLYRTHADRLYAPDDPDGAKERERKRLEQEVFEAEWGEIPFEPPNTSTVQADASVETIVTNERSQTQMKISDLRDLIRKAKGKVPSVDTVRARMRAKFEKGEMVSGAECWSLSQFRAVAIDQRWRLPNESDETN